MMLSTSCIHVFFTSSLSSDIIRIRSFSSFSTSKANAFAEIRLPAKLCSFRNASKKAPMPSL